VLVAVVFVFVFVQTYKQFCLDLMMTNGMYNIGIFQPYQLTYTVETVGDPEERMVEKLMPLLSVLAMS
jgi:hypothetical protein